MKKLACEMCGSADLMKENGVFVCQTCGCKYSVEEAKKLMVEGIVQVEGTVKIDNSDKEATYKEIAINAYNAGNTNEAYQYFLRVLEINPTDYQSIFYKGMCQGWETSLARPRVGEAVAAYNQAESHIPAELSQAVKLVFIGELIRLMSAWFGKAQENYFRVDDWYQSNTSIYYTYKSVAEQVIKFIDGFMETVVESNSGALLKEVGELYCSACEAVCSDIMIWTDYSKERAIFSGLSIKQKEPVLRDYDTIIFEVRKYHPGFRKPDSEYNVINRMNPPTSRGVHNLRTTEINYKHCLDADRAINQRLQKYKDELVQRQKRERKEKYWSEHLAEKQQYEERLTAIDSELSALRSQDAPFAERIAEIKKALSQPVPEESQLTELKNQHTALSIKKAKLGLFAGKQKKALQEQIDSLQTQINDVDTTVQRLKKEIREDVFARVSSVEEERKPNVERINALESEKNRINGELTKER